MRIEAHQLGKRFNREWIFRNFDFSFEQGKSYVILGPNGSGKSTLLQTLTGIIPSSAGQLKYFQGPSEIDSSIVFKDIAICAPYQDLIDEFTLSEMVDFHFKFKKCAVSISEFMDQSGLSFASSKLISTFSSGMRQRLKVALALYSECELLFLDEPCTNMDFKTIEWYQKELERVQEKLIIIASNQKYEYPDYSNQIDILAFKGGLLMV